MDTQGLKILPIVRDYRIQPEHLSLFEDLLRSIYQADDRLKDNYSPVCIDLNGHLCLDLLLDLNHRPIAFSGLYSGGRYPSGVYRALNRTYVHPDFRAASGVYVNWNSKFLLPRQLETYAGNIKVAFVSRETTKARGFLDLWTRKWAPDSGWSVSSGMAHINPHSAAGSAYQYIARKDFGVNAWMPEEIGPEEWLRRYG